MSEVRDYNTDIEELFIRFFITYPELFVRCKGIIDSKHYSTTQHVKTINFLEDHANKHSTLPTIDQISAVTGKSYEILDGMQQNHIDWFLSEYEQFARHKALEIEIFNAPELLQQGRYGEVEANIKRAVQIGLVKDLGTNYFLDIKKRLEAMKNKSAMIPTGWKDLDDKLYGGFERGTLNFFVGATGAGKSLFLQNIGVNFSMQGLDVLYLTLELSEKLCALRIDAMITGYGTKDVLRNVDDTELRIATFVKKYKGTFQIKQMLNGTTSNDFRAYIKEYEIQTGIKVDIVIVDYVDLCMPAAKKIDPSNLFIKDKFVSEELRNLAVELDVICVSAVQMNRCLSLDTKVNIKDIGFIDIQDVKINDMIESNTGYNRIMNIFPKSTQPVYKIRTKSGKEIICSANHVFPTNNGEKNINMNLKVGDKLLCQQNLKHY